MRARFRFASCALAVPLLVGLLSAPASADDQGPIARLKHGALTPALQEIAKYDGSTAVNCAATARTTPAGGSPPTPDTWRATVLRANTVSTTCAVNVPAACANEASSLRAVPPMSSRRERAMGFRSRSLAILPKALL